MLYPREVSEALAVANGPGSDAPPSVTTRATGLDCRKPFAEVLKLATESKAPPTLVSVPATCVKLRTALMMPVRVEYVLYRKSMRVLSPKVTDATCQHRNDEKAKVQVSRFDGVLPMATTVTMMTMTMKMKMTITMMTMTMTMTMMMTTMMMTMILIMIMIMMTTTMNNKRTR